MLVDSLAWVGLHFGGDKPEDEEWGLSDQIDGRRAGAWVGPAIAHGCCCWRLLGTKLQGQLQGGKVRQAEG